MWVKESCYYRGKHSRMIWPMNANGASLYGDENSDFMAKQWVSDSEETKEDKSETDCGAFTDPLLLELAGRIGRDKELEWIDPIVVNETTGWLAITSYGGPIDGNLHQCGSVSRLGSSLKKPRARPKNMNQS